MGSYTSVANNMPINDKLFLLQADIIKEAAKKGPFVIVGRCADYVLRDEPNCLNLFCRLRRRSGCAARWRNTAWKRTKQRRCREKR